MQALVKRGGAHSRAAREASRIIGSLTSGMEELNRLTQHGESRIQSCQKYDLTEGFRLVTVRTEGFIYLLYVGSHQDVDRWLDRNRELTISADKQSRRIEITYVTKHEPRRQLPPEDFGHLRQESVPLLKRLDGFKVQDFVPSGFFARQLEKVDDDTPDDEIQELISELSASGPELANMIFDVIFLVRQGSLGGAEARVQQYIGNATTVADDPALEEEALSNRINSDSAVVLSRLPEEEIKKLFEPDRFHEWMLFLHPEQKRIAEADYKRPVVLTGVSGSGKTCVLVHRARYLARKYPGERIGVLTLNRSLSRLLAHLLKELCTEEELASISVMAFYDYFKQLVEHFGPDLFLSQLSKLADGNEHQQEIQRAIASVNRTSFAREFDPRSGETLEDTWDLFTSQSHVRTQVSYFADHLRSYQRSLDPEQYLQEEFSLIRSALATSTRTAQYPEMERDGRAILLPPKERERVLNLLLLWEEVMLSGGVLDELSLTAALLPSRPLFRELPPELRFRCLLVDEFQDFSTLDLALLRLVPSSADNGLFVAGDPVQRVMVKSLRMGSVGLDIISAERERITKNYRNSKQILQAASRLANQFGEMARGQQEDIEILDPELAERETGKPRAIRVREETEISYAWELAREYLTAHTAVPWSINIATASPEAIRVEALLAGQPPDFPVRAARITGDYIQARDTLTVGTVADVKGFEFTAVIIVGCSQGKLPMPGRCADEVWRDALRLYVAMTRGRDDVCLIYADEPSNFLNVMGDDLEWVDATVDS